MAAARDIAGIAQVGAPILDRFDIANQSRDRALNEGRQIIRLSANTVRAIHRNELDEAAVLLGEASALLQNLLASLDDRTGIRWAGYVQDAMKEYAEACITTAFVTGEPVKSPQELGVDDAPFLNALAESASELRRLTLDSLRSGDFARAERLLAIMDEVYSFLVTVDYPDGLTGGLRRSTDALRAVLERTRGDLTLTSAQNRLQDTIREAMATLSSHDPAP
ncbi:MAG: haloacid dehalogenase [Thermomicrobiales bacterium]|jgi:translin|nr:haloacid dehalogenase [Thermomicrobiales bacterium]